MSYCVIQLDNSGNNTLATVHESWLTPLKKEVFWPPYKDSKGFKRALIQAEPVNAEKWILYGVQRIFYQSGELEKALKKEREAEITSDLTDSDLNDPEIGRPVRKKKKVQLSSDEEDDSEYVRPPQTKITKIIDDGEVTSYTVKFPEKVQPQLFPDATAKVVINILNQIKEQNKIILARFEAIEQRLDESVNKSGNLTIPKFPSKLPLTSIEELNTLEEYLQSQDKLQSFVSYCKSFGGKDLKSTVHNILKNIVTDELASSFSYFGKRGKQPFHKLTLNTAILMASRSKMESTMTEVEDFTKNWIKHALDRIKSRRKSAP